MEEKNKREEIQSRREFFKKAAKAALPVVGAIALASSPIISRAVNSGVVTGCIGCEGSCMASCVGTCDTGCKSGCKYECKSGCKYNCKGSCKNACVRASY